MNDGTERNVGERQAVADFDIGFWSAYDLVANLQSLRSEDVAFFAICIVQQSDTAGTVRIVFDRSNSCRNVIFISLEIDQSVLTFTTAALGS